MVEKMNESVKARWVAALRSGKYKQTKEHLKDRQGYCCLGVLCDIYATERGKSKWEPSRLNSFADGEFSIDHQDHGIPSAVVGIWAEFDWRRKVEIDGEYKQLYFHNDDGRTFAEIADAIEAQL
jgi:hypothetical protein